MPLHEQVVGEHPHGLLMLLGAVAFVLLIACVNIANLLLSRASGAAREMAVRRALGAADAHRPAAADRKRAAGARRRRSSGVLVASWGVAALNSHRPRRHAARRTRSAWTPRPRLRRGVCAADRLLFGLVPALQVARDGFTPALKQGGRGSAERRRRARAALIVAELALALVLLVGGGLLLRTFVRLQAVDLGFNPMASSPASCCRRRRIPDGRASDRLLRRVLARTAALPGVSARRSTSVIPLGGDSDSDFLIEGRPACPRRGAAT